MLHILHTEWSGNWGGQENRIVREMKGLQARGYRVTLACTPYAHIAKVAQAESIPTHFLPFKGNTDLKTLWGLVRFIREQRVDIVNTHSGKDTWVGGFAAKLAGAKFIRTRHLSNSINPSRLNFINELADFVITTGESVRAQMIVDNRIRPDRIQSIPSGINACQFDPQRYDRSTFRAQYCLQPDEFAIGIVAILRRFKRHDLFVDIAKDLLSRHTHLKFYIAGMGPQEAAIRERIARYGLESKIILTGYLNNPAELLAALDCFLLTSDGFEGVSQSLIQALMMNIPSIVADVGSLKDLYDGENFILVEPGKVESFVKAVESLLANPAQLSDLATHARASILSRFSDDYMLESIIKVYEKLMA